ncbi:MAG: response regulator [Gemmatimonadales bacterium]
MAPSPRKLILVIDDDPDQRRFLERMLSGAGYGVRTAPDGEAGLKLAVASPPSLIILDVMMPHLNGYQTCRALRKNPATSGLPIIVLTTKDQPADEFWASEVGADAFLPKAANLPLLLDTISRLTEAP